ncbi:MAG TPA: CBS domain-containing protein [Candidatus Dormibacteraeota bacterium]|nr:CBS domain-containing protein [Candidatus Dormibacteraeota bacterium]
MNNYIFGIVFLILALFGIVLRKTYFSLPLAELKRRARKHESHAEKLYRAAAYGNSLRSLLWLYIGLTSALSLILLARQLPVWLGVLIVGPLLWIVFSLLPASRSTRFGIALTRLATPLIAWLLNLLHPLLSRGGDFVQLHFAAPKHTGLYERDDLLQLIKHQQSLPDSRISREELEIVERALNFDSYKVCNVLAPRNHVKTVLADDVIGPVLIDELHKNGQDYVLVRESKKGPFVGTLAFSKLSIKSSGQVRDFMDTTVYYLHENDPLSEALHAFIVTNHPLFVVVDSYEEYVGIVSVEHILNKLLGHIPGDDFDQYTDSAAVAARHTKAEKPEEATKPPVKTDDEVVE